MNDDMWGFGQVVAVALLAAPFFQFYENIYGKCERFSNTTYIWTIDNHTNILFPSESGMPDKKKDGQLQTSAPPNSNSSSSPDFSSAEPWTALYKCAWFRSLVWLIYLQTLATAASVLIEFPWGGGSYDLKTNIGFFFKLYLAWFGVDLAMLLLFTITSLSLCHAQENDTTEFRWTWRAQKLLIQGPSKRTKLIRRIVLIASVLILTASSAMVGLFGFPTSPFNYIVDPSGY